MTNEIDWSGCYITKAYIKSNYSMTFQKDGKQIGAIDWNGPKMTFTGDVDESAKIFFDWIAEAFKGRLEQERAASASVEREVCLQIADQCADADMHASMAANAIRARGQS